MRRTRGKANGLAVTATVATKVHRNVKSGKRKQVEVIDCYGVAKWVHQNGVSGSGGEPEVIDLSGEGDGEGVGRIQEVRNRFHVKKENGIRDRAAENGAPVKEERNGTCIKVEANGTRVHVKEERSATGVLKEENGIRAHVREERNGTCVKEEENGSQTKKEVSGARVDEGEDGINIEEECNGIPLDEELNEADPALYLSAKIAEEEKILVEQRLRVLAESDESVPAQNVVLEDSMFSKLDDLLNKSQMYSQFLLEKMDKLKFTKAENVKVVQEALKKGRGRGGRGVKRKAAAELPTSCPGLPDGEEDNNGQREGDEDLTEEERVVKEQREIIPLLTGGQLKPFQLKGIKWMISLWQNGLNGILADQMGLGKTVQTIGLLAYHRGRGLPGPFLIIAPLSTLSNWVNEFKRFVPSMPVILYHGTKEERAEMRMQLPAESASEKFPVLVTSYEVAIFDRTHLGRRKWKYIIVDEGHRLKNFDCKLLRELKKVPVENKLLLSGTPLQNNLSELWSLLNFISPQIFTSLQQFESWFDLASRQSSGLNKEESEEQRRVEVVTKLHSILRPYLLRRMKKDVMKDIPPKKEIIFYAPLTETQEKFQNLLLERSLNQHFEGQKHPGATPKCRLYNVVMQLRKNANHPDLLTSHFDDSIDYPPVKVLLDQCGKLRLLDRLLKLLRARGHKVLIFSQMTRMLDVLEYYLQQNGMNPCRIDGNVKLADRRDQIREFNSDSFNRYVFLLSTRAGGLGINLTAADTVIIYDSDWNPQMDLQAMDRCHRIGQDKPVHVYRLLTSQTVECRMIKVANKKMHLERVVIEKGHYLQEQNIPKSKLEEGDLNFLLGQDRDEEEKYVQSAEISDADLFIAFDRADLMKDMKGHVPAPNPGPVLPIKGPGWEVVIKPDSTNSILSSIEGYRKFATGAEKTEAVDVHVMKAEDAGRPL